MPLHVYVITFRRSLREMTGSSFVTLQIFASFMYNAAVSYTLFTGLYMMSLSARAAVHASVWIGVDAYFETAY